MNDLEKVIQIIEKMIGFKLETKIDESTNLHNFGIDSLDMLDIVMEIEHEFNVEISDEDADHLDSLHSITALNFMKLVNDNRNSTLENQKPSKIYLVKVEASIGNIKNINFYYDEKLANVAVYRLNYNSTNGEKYFFEELLLGELE